MDSEWAGFQRARSRQNWGSGSWNASTTKLHAFARALHNAQKSALDGFEQCRETHAAGDTQRGDAE